MTADLVARLEIAAKIHDDMTGKGNAMAATIREAASALRSSGEAVAFVTRAGNLIGGLIWTDAGRNADLPDGTKLYLHPATPASAWRPIAEAQEGKLYVVGWLDGEDTKSPARHDFDYIEDGCWVGHEDCVQHAEACAPPGSRLPPREPPYQWLIEVPEFPIPPSSTKGG
jgi:hypothetical protein